MNQYEIKLPAFRRGFHLITDYILDEIDALPDVGLMHIFLHHTSAGLLINENADPSVRVDLNSSFDKLAPERMPHYTHTMEGDDDMPAHIKAALTGIDLCIPIKNGRPKLGTWQGIYLAEFRDRAGSRRITVTVTP